MHVPPPTLRLRSLNLKVQSSVVCGLVKHVLDVST